MPDESELDYFDRSDLAGLRRLVKGALKDYEREKALYLEVGLRTMHKVIRLGGSFILSSVLSFENLLARALSMH